MGFNEYEEKDCKGANLALTNVMVSQSKELQKGFLTNERSAQKPDYVPKWAFCFQKQCVPLIENYSVDIETRLGK